MWKKITEIYINVCLSIKYRQFRKRRYFISVMWHQNTVYLNKKARIPGYQNPLPSLKKRREKQEQEKQQQQQKQFISVIIRNCFIWDNLILCILAKLEVLMILQLWWRTSPKKVHSNSLSRLSFHTKQFKGALRLLLSGIIEF